MWKLFSVVQRREYVVCTICETGGVCLLCFLLTLNLLLLTPVGRCAVLSTDEHVYFPKDLIALFFIEIRIVGVEVVVDAWHSKR